MNLMPHLSNEEYFRYWRACALTGPVFLAAFLLFWGVLGYNIPPLPADMSTQALG